MMRETWNGWTSGGTGHRRVASRMSGRRLNGTRPTSRLAVRQPGKQAVRLVVNYTEPGSSIGWSGSTKHFNGWQRNFSFGCGGNKPIRWLRTTLLTSATFDNLWFDPFLVPCSRRGRWYGCWLDSLRFPDCTCAHSDGGKKYYVRTSGIPEPAYFPASSRVRNLDRWILQTASASVNVQRGVTRNEP